MEGSIQAGAAIGERDSVRTGPGARAVLQLADGSMVDINERTEVFVTAAWSGQAIHLQRGDIIVSLAGVATKAGDATGDAPEGGSGASAPHATSGLSRLRRCPPSSPPNTADIPHTISSATPTFHSSS